MHRFSIISIVPIITLTIVKKKKIIIHLTDNFPILIPFQEKKMN